MDWVFWLYIPATLVHVAEEYLWPGGFLAWFRAYLPRFAPRITPRWALRVNGLNVALATYAAVAGERDMLAGLMVASLMVTNAALHLWGSYRIRRYSPGAITGVLLHMPLGIGAFYVAGATGRLHPILAAEAVLLGAALQLVPILWQLILLRRRGAGKPELPSEARQ